jgi:alkanesulfonate monooxygenase SsuD/methylene tetrahydromethanopterin reductase-like flavin-dependent oxidoreductase (luciferase family)
VIELAGDRDLELSWGGPVVLGRDDADARARLGGRDGRRFTVGGPASVAARLAEIVDAGARHLILSFPSGRDDTTYLRLANEVAPSLRG